MRAHQGQTQLKQIHIYINLTNSVILKSAAGRRDYQFSVKKNLFNLVLQTYSCYVDNIVKYTL